jgi:fibronectin-binding autotransporter adhesin
LGADPGFEVSGDDVGLYVGVDRAWEHGSMLLRGGAYLGYLHGVYWTTGANSSGIDMDPARVELDTPVGGLYASGQWSNGSYLDLVLSAQRPDASVRTTDGFVERIDGDTLTLSARFGHSYHLDNGWMLEPQLQLSASHVQWDDKVDAGGRQLMFDDDLVGSARAALRVERAFTTAGGAQIRPWATLAVQNVLTGDENGLRVTQPGSSAAAQAFPGHDFGTSANLDLGVEAGLGEYVSLFGVISLGQDLDGSDLKQRSANLGLRVRW